MAICKICNKKVLLPIQLESETICKTCFMKLKGPFWMYKHYEKQSDVEKQRMVVLEKANSLNFPQNIVSAINTFFDKKLSVMFSCAACNSVAKTMHPLVTTHVCNECFSKINVTAWQTENYESKTQVDYNRSIILNIASMNNFSQVVIEDINRYFDKKTDYMVTCNLCNTVVATVIPIGKAKICQHCFSKINILQWKQKEYICNEDVEKNRAFILSIANENNFSQLVIDGINNHFDQKIQPGLFRIIDGGLKQTLGVYDTHCILSTKPSFDKETALMLYDKIIGKYHEQKKISTNIHEDEKSVAVAAVKGLVTGGLFKASKNAVMTYMDNNAHKEVVVETPKYRSDSNITIYTGKKTINYSDFDRVDYQKVVSYSEGSLGFLRFRNSRYYNDPKHEVLFFYNDSDCIKNAYDFIQSKMDEIHLTPQVKKEPAPSVLEEMTTYKKLLDDGIITQEEFDKKKREILNL